ncbi:Protease inhibitor protein [Plasmopara halstedii]|uniref:Protease inhibitor protein n=1 Tax=Plasmopara halstedii TaxID=4781 RepID=A0A0P1B4P5_PLAHL|nr:Protease inhibitor protein [Plasmopara halstedii]CEG49465.1 Protease inhibitor protein [Plasmopara halstedii]|eukprot:XP_024585834.1 Protease inhibitor protein [Plasmopara halstedii]
MLLKILAFGLVYNLATGQGPSLDEVVNDQLLRVGSDQAARVDCSQLFECKIVSYSPVCGSDGITYANYCVFAKKYCSLDQGADTLYIQSQGKCFSTSENDKYQDGRNFAPLDERSTLSQYDTLEVDTSSVFCSLTCQATSNPVCGTDGVTYTNDCHLLSTKCKHPHLEKRSDGACKRDHFDILEIDDTIYTDAAEEKCNSMCKRLYEPICGSDGVTYANLCLLEYAECRNPNIKVFGPGKCPIHMQIAHTTHNSESKNNNDVSCIPELCTDIYAPVCGSDGQTHENLCLFSNARCQYPNHELSIIHDGECNVDTQITCDTMTCPMFTECREKAEADSTIVAYCADVCSPDRCGELDECQLVDSDCFTAPCSPIAMCVPKTV